MRKVELFRSLFRGREEMFAVRWENAARQKAGYAPCCANEWKGGVCEKPRVRCGACPNQAFLVDDSKAMLAHLQGRKVMGIYPLLPDETGWLLAIDLDGESWPADAAEVIGTIGGGRRKPSGLIDVETVQTLARAEFDQATLDRYGHVVVDECHHVPAVPVERLLGSFPARYVAGLTATPYRRDGHQPIITMQ